MKEVIVAKHAGFCFGVKRAVAMAFETIPTNHGRKIYTFGELIHNKQVLGELAQNGVRAIESLQGIEKGSIVIIRSHGVAPTVYQEATAKGIKLVDATCKFVKNAHKKIMELEREGYMTVIVGEEDHPEVRGLREYAKNTIVIGRVEEIPSKIKERHSKIGIISQTTQPMKNFNEVVTNLLGYGDEFKVFNTICSATSVRQEEASNLAKEVEIMIVVGGKQSANTTKLAQACSEIVETHHVEEAADIQKNWFTGKTKVGMTAGASTPSEVIEEVAEKIRKLD